MTTIQKITANWWFDKNAEEAVKFYTGVFKNSSINKTTHYGKEGFNEHKMPEGTVMTIDFTLEGQKFLALNAGAIFKFNEAISFVINCDSQDELDYYWNKLSPGGDEKSQICGWLKDKFGLSWQIVPSILPELLSDEDTSKRGRVINAVMKMKKLNIKELEEAAENK
jgi:predicted 3-demethylubiquinone-9 3-methyltransferase (glyoxalase superfamily)